MAINRERDHVAESSEEVSMYVGREGRKQGALEGQRRLGPLSCPGRASYKLGMVHYVRNVTGMEMTEQRPCL